MRAAWTLPFAVLTALALLSLVATEQAPTVTGGPLDVGDTAWLLTATGLVLLMTPGLSFFYAGMVRTKNVISTMLQSFIALGAPQAPACAALRATARKVSTTGRTGPLGRTIDRRSEARGMAL